MEDKPTNNIIYSTLLDNINIGIIAVSNQKIFAVNQKFSDITGFKKDEVINKNIIDICPNKQSDGKLTETILNSAFRNSLISNVEFPQWQFLTKNKNKTISCHITINSVFNGDDHFIIFEISENLSQKDLTKKLKEKNKQIESLSEERESLNEELRATLDELVEVNKQLADSEFWNKTIVENIPLGLQVINNNETEYYNEKIMDITGCIHNELKNKTIFNFVIPEEKEKIDAFFEEIRSKNLTESMIECWIENIQGQKKFIRTQYVKLNKETRWMLISTDLTENKLKEEELLAARERLEFAVETNESLIWDFDLSQNESEAQISIGKLFDYSPGELKVNKNIWQEIVHPEDLPKVLNDLDRHYKDKIPYYETECRLRTRSGEYKWVLARGKIYNKQKKDTAGHFIGMFVDISRRKKAEEQLVFSEEKFRTIVQHLSDLIFIIDRELKVTYESPSVSRIFGYEPGFFIGKSALQYIHPSEVETAKAEFQKLLENQNDYKPIELRIRHKQGFWIYVEVLGDDLSHHPAIGGILITARDISERKENEVQLSLYRNHLEQLVKKRTEEIEHINAELIAINEEIKATNEELAIKNEKLNNEIVKRIEAQLLLEESENKFRSFIEQSTEGIILIDEEGKIVDWNKGMEMIFNIFRDEIINTYVWDFDYRFLPGKQKTKKQLNELKKSTLKYFSNLEPSKVMTIEGIYQTIELKQKYLSVTIFPVITPKRKYLGRIIRDISNIKRAQEEIEKQSDELKKINENLEHQKNQLENTLTELRKTQAQLIHSEKMASLGVLTAGVAHEINNPVNYINTALEGLKITLTDFFKIFYLYESINHSNIDEKLKEVDLLKEELNFPLLQQGINVLLNNMQTGIERITEIVKSLRTFARIEENELKFSNVHELIDTTLVMLHNQYKNRIEIIKNYGFINSINCYPGKLSQVFMNILSNAIQAIPDKGVIKITTFTDEKNHNFVITIKDNGTGIPEEIQDKIFEPFFTTKEAGKGTGLGLSISYGIIQQHKGNIEFKTKKGEGTEFIISLPTDLK